MLQFYRGRVKLFKRDKRYGFIVPTQKGGADVFLHANHYSGMSNDFGELEFDDGALIMWTPDYHEPKPQEEVVYCEWQDPCRGLRATYWAFAKEWDHAQFMVGLFKNHGDGFIRVMRSGIRENRYRPTLIWKGTRKEFASLLDRHEIDYDESVYTEELMISSKWQRSWHDPRNWHPNYKKMPNKTREHILASLSPF